MKKIDLGQKLQLVGHIGVIVGILLLLYELNQNRVLMMAQTRNEIAQNVVAQLTSDTDNLDLADLIRRGHNRDSLSESEQWVVDRRYNAWFRLWENMHYQYRTGLYDEIEFATHREGIQNALTRPGQVDYWCRVSALYSPDFAAEIDGLLTEHKCE